MFFVFFFFQAEDGIRDATVTGVQTCALPISPIRLAVLLSGGGTTLQNLLDRIADGRLHAQVVLVVSNRSDALGLTRAERAGIRTAVVPRKEHDSESCSGQIFDLCRQARVELVCLA